MEQIVDALLADDDRIRVVTVFGQGGIGKTALACRVMKALESHQAVHGLVYLSTRTTGISFERVLRDSPRLLGGDIERRLMNTWKKEDADPLVRVQALLEAYGTERRVL